jgi:hypothetical protein
MEDNIAQTKKVESIPFVVVLQINPIKRRRSDMVVDHFVVLMRIRATSNAATTIHVQIVSSSHPEHLRQPFASQKIWNLMY